MEVDTPSNREPNKEKRRKWLNFLMGFIIGIMIFGLGGLPLFTWGIGEIKIVTWIALGFGAISFGFLGMLFGSNFHRSILSLFNW